MVHVYHVHHNKVLKHNYLHNVINVQEVQVLIYHVLVVQVDSFYNKLHLLHKLLVLNVVLDVQVVNHQQIVLNVLLVIIQVVQLEVKYVHHVNKIVLHVIVQQ